jgi:hypothetical protein
MHPRSTTTAALLLAVLATSGCDAVLTSAKLPEIQEDRVLGQWKDLGTNGSKPDPDPVFIRFINGEYRVGSAEEFAKENATPFTLARAGSVLIAQSPNKGQCDEFGGEKGRPCWNLYRLDLLGDKMNWYDFDTDRLVKDSVAGTLNVVHSLHRQRKQNGTFDNAILISADAPELVAFLESYVKRSGVFKLTGRLQRVP